MTCLKVAVGIDLGTSNSCVGVVRNGRVEIIANEFGYRITPSIVAFTDDGPLIGNAAKEQALDNSTNTVFDAKRLIGGTYNNPHMKTKMKTWPFMVKNVDGSPKIEVGFQGGKKIISPEEISSMVLIRMKEIAEDFIGSPVTDAVITVPAYFNDSQRQATVDAGVIAGLNVLCIINEPTAAAIAYGVDKKVKETQKVLVFDLGGGTFDVAILEISNGIIDVLAVSGNALLGGGDFDERLMDHCIKEFKKKKKLDISKDPKALLSLRRECEKAKIGLSNPNLLQTRVVTYFKGVELVCQISRSRLEYLCSDLFDSTLGPVKTVLQDSKLDVSDIDEVLLVGGSTRIPKIRELVEGFFHGKNVNLTINPDEAVAFGAALYAATLVQDRSVDEITLRDVTPLSIGINVLGEKMSTIIYRNSKLPTKNTKQYTTTCHNQTAVDIKVYEGVDSLIINNHLLGEFTLNGIQVALKGVPDIKVTFEVDRNGILNVSAVDASSNSKETIKITSNKGRLNKKEIDEKMTEANKLREFGAKRKELNEARSMLESFCLEKKRAIKEGFFQGHSPEHYSEIIDNCDENLLWLEEAEGLTKDVILVKKEELEEFCSH